MDKRTVLRLDPAGAGQGRRAAAVAQRGAESQGPGPGRGAAQNWNIEFDDAGAIGRRYRRQDEIGTPFCVTVDFDTLEDQAVTVRDRDAMTQERIGLDAVVDYLAVRLKELSRPAAGTPGERACRCGDAPPAVSLHARSGRAERLEAPAAAQHPAAPTTLRPAVGGRRPAAPPKPPPPMPPDGMLPRMIPPITAPMFDDPPTRRRIGSGRPAGRSARHCWPAGAWAASMAAPFAWAIASVMFDFFLAWAACSWRTASLSRVRPPA